MFDKLINNYLGRIYNNLTSEINDFTDSKITTADFDEWVKFFYSKYEIEPITFFPDNAPAPELTETTEEMHIMTMGWNGPEHIIKTVPAYKVTFSVPFDGDSNLFEYTIENRIITIGGNTPVYDAHIERPRGSELGKMTFSLIYKEGFALADTEKFQTQVNNDFQAEVKKYERKLDTARHEVERFNSALNENILKLLTERKKKADNFGSIAKALNVSLKLNANAPNIVPAPLKRVVKEFPKQPSNKPIPQEHTIKDSDFENIKRIINLSAISMEKNPKPYLQLDEEGIRDVILTSLNSHYEASGETFNKKGKTDILIKVENKAAYIAECKIWHGIKLFDEAIEQLKSYATWRDTKVSIIIFNKTIKNFIGLTQTIDSWVNEKTTRVSKQTTNIWNCSLKDKETSQVYQLHIAVYDLYVKGGSK